MRGAVYHLRPAKSDSIGHEQQCQRYAVVVQATRLEHWSTWIIIPTSASPNARRGLLRPVIDFGYGECVAMIDAIRAVDPERRLGEHVGYISLAEMQSIDKALMFILDLVPVENFIRTGQNACSYLCRMPPRTPQTTGHTTSSDTPRCPMDTGMSGHGRRAK